MEVITLEKQDIVLVWERDGRRGWIDKADPLIPIMVTSPTAILHTPKFIEYLRSNPERRRAGELRKVVALRLDIIRRTTEKLEVDKRWDIHDRKQVRNLILANCTLIEGLLAEIAEAEMKLNERKEND